MYSFDDSGSYIHCKVIPSPYFLRENWGGGDYRTYSGSPFYIEYDKLLFICINMNINFYNLYMD